MGGASMNKTSKPVPCPSGRVPAADRTGSLRFYRRSRRAERVFEIDVPFTEDEYALVEARAAAAGLGIEDYILMCALDAGRSKGHA